MKSCIPHAGPEAEVWEIPGWNAQVQIIRFCERLRRANHAEDDRLPSAAYETNRFRLPCRTHLPRQPARVHRRGTRARSKLNKPRTRAAWSSGKASPTAHDSRCPVSEIQFDRSGLISMHTNELDVRQLLELISRRSGMNILVSPKVTGTITANFEKVTIQELLASILKLADLTEKVEGGIHFIYSREELKDVAEVAKKEKIVTKIYRLNYIRADELMVMITPFLSQDVGRKRFATSANYPFGISESSTLATGGSGSGGGGAGGGGGGGGGGVAAGGAGTIQRGTQPVTGGVLDGQQ